MTTVFNENKTIEQYQIKQPLFFGPEPGLFDTVNKHYPKIWSLYKTMKSLDWDENEFDYTQCNIDFKTCPKSVSSMMIRTLAWQYEADSVASRAIAPVLAPFITDSSLWAAWQRISDNEVVHASTYSEIVRMSFDNPEEVLKDILSVKESFARLDTVAKVLSKLQVTSHKYALGLVTVDVAYDDLLMGIIALFLLERVQFTSSFAITFTICALNWFQSIGKAIQKIAQDELEVHSELDKEVLRIELASERGRASYARQKDLINKLFHEVVESEMASTDYMFSEGRELTGSNAATVKQFVLFNAREVAIFLDIDTDIKFPKVNPMPHVESWINISSTQSANQEQDNNQYKVGTIVRDDEAENFTVDF